MPLRANSGCRGTSGEIYKNHWFDKLVSRENRVLSQIIALSFLNGVTSSVENTSTRNMDILYPLWMSQYIGIGYILLPITGITLLALLSEIKGRKATLMFLFFLSILNSVLYMLTYLYIFIIHALVSDGTTMMTLLAITEYCSPKHRFAYLVANTAILSVGSEIFSILTEKVFNKGIICILSFEIVLGILCLVSPWPESPYWLASKGRYEESRETFLWLREEDNDKELRIMIQENRRPSPRLFWLALIPAIATLFVNKYIISWQGLYMYYVVGNINFMDNYNDKIIEISCGIGIIMSVVWISYKVQRKCLYLMVTLIPLTLYYVIVLWFYVEDKKHSYVFSVVSYVSNILWYYSLYTIGLASFIEIVPYKYNTIIMAIWSASASVSLYLVHKLNFAIATCLPGYLLIPILSSVSVLCVVVYYVFSPETKGKTLMEIQKLIWHNRLDQNNGGTSVPDQMLLQNL